jgi:hypothetical protein
MKTKQEVNQTQAAVHMILAVADAIRELETVPEGHLYARLMGHMSLENFTKIIDTLVNAGLVTRESSHLLVWNEAAK